MSDISLNEDGAPVLLSRASNVKIFEKLATPHMVDSRRVEEVKQYNDMSELPIGRQHSTVSVAEDRTDVHPAVAALNGGGTMDDSIAAVIREGLRRDRHSPEQNQERFSPEPSVASRDSARVSRRSSRHETPSPHISVASSAPSTPRTLDPRVFNPAPWNSQPTPQNASLPVRRTEPPPLPSMDNTQPDAYMRELERIQSSANRPGPNLESMRTGYNERSDAPPEAPVFEQGTHRSYISMFRSMCKSRQKFSAGQSGSGGYRPHNDPNYAEKRELIIKLDELRTMGFNVPQFDMCMPVEDLQSELARRTVSMGTVSTVDTVIGWINAAANIIETINNMAGPFLPMDNYAKSVEEGTSTPRFKYAMYQLVLRWHGRSGSSPWREVLMVLLMPLVQGVLIKVVQWLAKGRVPFPPSTISAGVKSLFSMAKSDPNKGVPTGIPGISPDLPKMDVQKPPSPPKPRATSKTIPNPFANRYPKAEEAKAPAKPSQAPPIPTQNKNQPVKKRTRPRLQRPSEVADNQSTISDAPSGIVLTPEQMREGVTSA